MDKYKIIEKDLLLEELKFPYEYDFGTHTEYEKAVGKKDSNIIMVIAGILTLAPSIQALNTSDFIFDVPDHSVESCLGDYNKFVNKPFAEFIYNIENLTRPYIFLKEDVVKKVISYRSLNDKWDGYSALPLEVESASNALNFIDYIGDEFLRKLDDFYPNTNGTISFEWRNESDEEISLEIGNKFCSYYVALNSQKPLFFNNIEINAFEAKIFSKHIQVL